MEYRKNLLRYLYEEGSTSLEAAAAEAACSWLEAWAYFIGLHDYGIVTVYGRNPEATIRMDDAGYMDPWVASQLA